MTVLELLGIITVYSSSYSLAGAVGTMIVPALAAASGGALNVAIACAIGSGIMFFPVIIINVILLKVWLEGLLGKQQYFALMYLGTLLVATNIALTAASASIGAAIIGVTTLPVTTCCLLGCSVFVASLVAIAAVVLMICGLAVLKLVSSMNSPDHCPHTNNECTPQPAL